MVSADGEGTELLSSYEKDLTECLNLLQMIVDSDKVR